MNDIDIFLFIINSKKDDTQAGFKLIEMLESGVDPNIKNEKGENILMTSLVNRKEELAKFIIDISDDIGLDLNYQNENSSGMTALMYALRESECNLAMQIIRKGADVQLTTTYDETALHWATPECPEVMKLLVKDGVLGLIGTDEFNEDLKEFLSWCRRAFTRAEMSSIVSLFEELLK